MGRRLRGLERGEEAAARGERALDRLHLDAVRPPVVVPEVRVGGAARDDEAVVAQLLGRGDAGHGAEAHHACVEIEVADLREQDADVGLALEDRPQRIRDLAGGQRTGRHLVGERLEEVEVAPVDERDLDRSPAQPGHHPEAAEASADDHDSMCRALHARSRPSTV